jgi:chromosome segregation ATPase
MALSRLFVVAAVFATAACSREPEKALQEAEKAQAQAVEKANKEFAQAGDRATEAYNRAADAADKAYERAGEKWAEAAEAVAEAKRDLKKDAEEKLAEVEKTLVDVRADLNTKKGVPADARAQVDALKARTDALRNDVKNIDTAAAQTFQATKNDLEARLEELRRAAGDLRRRI